MPSWLFTLALLFLPCSTGSWLSPLIPVVPPEHLLPTKVIATQSSQPFPSVHSHAPACFPRREPTVAASIEDLLRDLSRPCACLHARAGSTAERVTLHLQEWMALRLLAWRTLSLSRAERTPPLPFPVTSLSVPLLELPWAAHGGEAAYGMLATPSSFVWGPFIAQLKVDYVCEAISLLAPAAVPRARPPRVNASWVAQEAVLSIALPKKGGITPLWAEVGARALKAGPFGEGRWFTPAGLAVSIRSLADGVSSAEEVRRRLWFEGDHNPTKAGEVGLLGWLYGSPYHATRFWQRESSLIAWSDVGIIASRDGLVYIGRGRSRTCDILRLGAAKVSHDLQREEACQLLQGLSSRGKSGSTVAFAHHEFNSNYYHILVELAEAVAPLASLLRRVSGMGSGGIITTTDPARDILRTLSGLHAREAAIESLHYNIHGIASFSTPLLLTVDGAQQGSRVNWPSPLGLLSTRESMRSAIGGLHVAKLPPASLAYLCGGGHPFSENRLQPCAPQRQRARSPNSSQAAACSFRDSARPSVLLIRRRGSRVLTNFEALEAAISAMGARVEVMDDAHPMPPVRAAKLFARADAVVAAHGAGLANIVLCSPGTIVLEIVHAKWNQRMYAHVAAVLGFVYHRWTLPGGGQDAPEMEAPVADMVRVLCSELGD